MGGGGWYRREGGCSGSDAMRPTWILRVAPAVLVLLSLSPAPAAPPSARSTVSFTRPHCSPIHLRGSGGVLLNLRGLRGGGDEHMGTGGGEGKGETDADTAVRDGMGCSGEAGEEKRGGGEEERTVDETSLQNTTVDREAIQKLHPRDQVDS